MIKDEIIPEADIPLLRSWVEELRSGKYTQTEGRLKSYNGCYCCLGVLCEISGCGKWVNTGSGFNFKTETSYTTYYLPYELVNLVPNENGIADALVGMNDEGKSFSEIADWIEKRLDDGYWYL